jgi:copper chaperone CopZ
MLRLALFLAALVTARAEFLHVEVFMRDMNCQSCSESLAGSFKRLRGVEKVDVSMEKGSVLLDLAKSNRISVEQVWDAIKRVGFTPGETVVAVHGAIKKDAGKSMIEVTDLGRTYEIDGDVAESADTSVEGSIQPPPDPRTPIRIRVK